VASIAELHFGVLVTDNPDERARRADRLAAVEATFDPCPSAPRLHVPGQARLRRYSAGGNPRRRQIDLAIAATAAVEQVPLLTYNVADSNSSLTWSTCACLRPLPASISASLAFKSESAKTSNGGHRLGCAPSRW